METKDRILFLTEGVKESVIRDAVSFFSIAGLIGLGVFLDSSAMQWVGAIIAMLSIFVRAASLKAGAMRHTPQEAADLLAKEYGVTSMVQRGSGTGSGT